MSLRSELIQKWWPTTQAMDLVEGSIGEVAAAVENELRRYLPGGKLTASWEGFADLDAAFRSAPYFSSFPRHHLVLPTRSRWTVLWNNSTLCNGYDSLCHNLTRTYGLTTVNWAAHDEWTSFQSGSHFLHRRWNGSSVVERGVHASQQDKQWHFSEYGKPLPQEDLTAYSARRKRDRLNESVVMQFLGRLGAFPWSEDFYALSEQPCFVARETDAPASHRRSFSELGQARFK